MDYVTIPDVELCSAGMAWPSASGIVTLTMDHIADAAAAGEDPHIVPARLKIGHTDPRFADPDDPGHDPFYDGEPAFGSIHNLRLTNGGATLVGDYVNVPAWFAETLPSAYPSRSVEGAYSIVEGSGGKLEARWDVVTPAQKTYSFVLTACSLLGVQRPAVQDLEDLRFLLTEGEGVVVTGDPDAEGAEGGGVIAVSLVGMDGVQLEASVDKVVDVFYAEVATGDQYWWWVRDVRVDPNVLVVDDDDGSLWLYPIESDGDQNITFGDPERVLQTFRPAPAAAAVLAAAVQGVAEGRIVKAFAARAQSAPEGRKEHPEGGVPPSASISGMNFSELSAEQRIALCKRLDLAEDASDEQITDALTADPAPADPPADPPVDDPPADPPADPPVDPPPAASGDLTVPVDKAVWEDTQAKVARLSAVDAENVAKHRKGVIEAALADGKIAPASEGAWLTKLNATPEATEAELAALPENLIPVDREVGHGGGPGSAATTTDLDLSEEEVLFPQLRGKAAGKVA